jgi:hypothetical protein
MADFIEQVLANLSQDPHNNSPETPQKPSVLTDFDREMLKVAFAQAKAGYDEGGIPIGSVFAREG